MKKYAVGFSLLEYLIVLSILLITISIGLHAWHTHWQKSRTQYIVGELTHSFIWARHIAVTYHTPVLWCGSMDGKHCSTRWDKGWIVRIETSDHLPLWRSSPLRSNEHITLIGARKTSALRISASGALEGENSTLQYCNDPCTKPTALIFSDTGRIRS